MLALATKDKAFGAEAITIAQTWCEFFAFSIDNTKFEHSLPQVDNGATCAVGDHCETKTLKFAGLLMAIG